MSEHGNSIPYDHIRRYLEDNDPRIVKQFARAQEIYVSIAEKSTTNSIIHNYLEALANDQSTKPIDAIFLGIILDLYPLFAIEISVLQGSSYKALPLDLIERGLRMRIANQTDLHNKSVYARNRITEAFAKIPNFFQMSPQDRAGIREEYVDNIEYNPLWDRVIPNIICARLLQDIGTTRLFQELNASAH